MRDIRTTAGALVSIVLLLSMAPFQAQAQAQAKHAAQAMHKAAVNHQPEMQDTSRFFPESDLKYGQQGYALTVFQGTKIERFGVEILGVMSKINNGKDLILIKVTSGPSVTRHINIAAGMSGSPVYIGSRMVGAIAYALPFAREPIGLVTPIADMLDAWDPDLPSHPDVSLVAAAQNALSAVPVDASAVQPYLDQSTLGGDSLQPTSTMTFEPVSTPVMVSGVSPDGIARLAHILSPFRLTPMAGGGMPGSVSAAERNSAKMVPGAAVGVSLVQGDVDMTAIGTLTYRDKNRIVAFGHPFTGIGPIDAALTTASITDIFPSYQDSTKLGSPLATVGRIFQDRPYSVGGELGVMPHMVPMTVDVDDMSIKRHRVYHADIINHPLLTGALVLQVAQQAIVETHGTPGSAIATVTTEVDADQVGKVVRKNIVYDALSIDQTSIEDLQDLLHILTSNPFYPLSIRSVKLTVVIRSSHATAEIDHIFVPKTHYQPGDTVNVSVVLKPFEQDPVVQTVALVIPSTTPDGPVTVQIHGGGSTGAQSISLAGQTIVISRPAGAGPQPSNVTQLVHQFLDQPTNNDLVSILQLPTEAVTVQGENLSLLPPIMSSVMRSARTSGVRLARDEVKKTVATPYVLTGSQTLVLNVARKPTLDSDDSAPTDPSASASPVSAPPASDDSSSSATAVTTGDTELESAKAVSPAVEPQANLVTPEAEPAIPNPSPGASTAVKPGSISPASAASDPSAAPPAALPDSGDGSTRKKSVVRAAQVWTENSGSDFTQGTLDKATVTSADDVRLAFAFSPLGQSISSYVWSLAIGGDHSLYAGTGDDGIVYKLPQSGPMAVFFRTKELEVTALVADPASGDLYAGTSPHGVIFRIHPNGTGGRVFAVPDKYITALALDSSRGELYATTGGGGGSLYAIPLLAPSTGKLLFASPETHLLSLAVAADGTLYAGGSPDGIVYAVSPDGKSRVVYDAPQANITALAVDPKGVLYAATSPSGYIYQIKPSDDTNVRTEVKTLSARPKAAVSALQIDSGGNVWATSSDTIYSVSPDDITYTYVAPSDVSLLSLAIGDDGRVYAGTGNTATVYSLGPSAASGAAYQGTYTSPVHDAHRPARWGSITWQSSAPPQTEVALETRSGDVPRPDSTWSAWSPPYSVATGEQVVSPPARFIQYRAVMTSSRGSMQPGAMPRLQAVSIYYLTRSQPPVVTVTSPSAGDIISGKSTLHWSGVDTDRDTLSYRVLYSSDGGKTYQPLPHAASVTAPDSTTSASSKPDTASAADISKMKSELDLQPEIPDAVKAQMLRQVTASAEPAPNDSDGDTDHLSKTSLNWNSRGVPDGNYRIKVVASDYQSEPGDPRTGEGVSGQFLVVNTPPVLTLDTASADPSTRIATLHGVASSSLDFVKSVQYTVDGSKDAYAAIANDGIFDSVNVPFSIVTLPLPAGVHHIVVQAQDQAGNSTSSTAVVTVP